MKSHVLTALTLCAAVAACNRSEQKPADENMAAESDVFNNMTGGVPPAGTVDSAFVTDAIKGDNGEVAIGKLALAQGQSQSVKDFGTLLVSDHAAHKQEVAALAQSAGIPVTDEPTDEAQSNLEKLKALRGAEFDKQFKMMMVEDHTKDIAKYEKQASSGDAQSAALARKTLPTLRKHLDAAKGL